MSAGNTIEDLGIIAGGLAAHAMHGKAGIGQRLPQGIAIGSRRFHRYHQTPLPCELLKRPHQLAHFAGDLRLPGPFEMPLTVSHNGQGRQLPNIHTDPNGSLCQPIHHLPYLDLLDRRGTIRSLSHGDDLLRVMGMKNQP